jgi:PAS domain S-box-containing protein
MPQTKDRLLIVEDSPTQAEQLRWSLEQAQFSVEIASSAEQALDMFSPDAFDLVVSDVVMPGASGFELCKRIKARADGYAVPVVLLSASNDPMTIIRALESGADNFLTKPYELRHLISRIRTALSNRTLRTGGKFKLGVEVMFMGEKFAITSEKEQILDLLMSTFEDIVRTNAELEVSQQTLASAQHDLERHARHLEQLVAAQTHELRERQRQLRDAQTIASMGDWFCDASFRSIRWSDQIYHIFGLDEAVFTPDAESIMTRVAPEDRERGRTALHDAIERKTPFQLEVRICRPDGDERICRVTGNPEIDDNGKVLGAFGVAQDITEWRQMQAEVIETGDRFRQLFESTPDGVLVTTHGSINLANTAALKIFGVDQPDELLGRNVFEFFDPDLRARVEKLASDLAEGNTVDGGTAQCSGHLNRADGQSLPIELTCSASTLSDPPSTHFIIRDVSRRLAMEEQLFQVQKMEAVGQLTGGISHDFNNLLSIIIGNLDVVKEQVADPEVAEALDEALQAALRGAELNQRLLAFSRRQALSPKPTPVNELVFTTSRLLQRALGERIDLKLQLEADPDSALVDAAQLEAAVTNLAVNARDAMPHGGELRIRTRRHQEVPGQAAGNGTRKPGDYVVVEVSDSGTGMEPEVQRRACDPFFTTKEEGKGTGLGLSMVHGFMEQSGGALQIASKVNEGTTVSLFLPVAPEDAAPIRGKASPEPDGGEGEIILVVEDNDRLRRVLIKQLRALGYDTIEAAHAASAVEILRSERHIDLLFTDLVMPGPMDGQQLAEAAGALRPGIKVILTSGFSEALLDRQELGTVSAPLLRKPYRREDLARVLRKALRD